MRGHIHTLVPKDAVEYVDAPLTQFGRRRTQSRQPHPHLYQPAREREPVLGWTACVDPRTLPSLTQAYRDELCAALSTAFPALAPSIADELATEHA